MSQVYCDTQVFPRRGVFEAHCGLKWSSWHFETSFLSVVVVVGFFFLLQLSSGIRKSFTTWFWHTDVLKKEKTLVMFRAGRYENRFFIH